LNSINYQYIAKEQRSNSLQPNR